ncbi:hypothetical protein [Lacibacter cauensis]|nr:hypothetical protein [Lacibacter cauensis]
MNFSMFLPQIAEKDSFTLNGQQQDDINSLIEYIDQVVLENNDSTPEDEDDDGGQHFILIKTVDLFSNNAFADLAQTSISISTTAYPSYKGGDITLSAFDILSPPPEV